MTAQMPSCPLCGTPDNVIALDPPQFRAGSPIADTDQQWPFECLTHPMVFTGTDAEWERMRWEREKRQAERERSGG